MSNTSNLNKARKPYNAFEHLCSVAFPYDATERVMAFFSAYFDESGTHDSRILTVAGYVATVEQWAEFAREWNEVLKKEGVKIFHMKDFENGYGEFTEEKGWTKERKINFQNRLIGIIKRRVTTGVYTSVDILAYEELMTGWRRTKNGSPYNFCVTACIGQIGLLWSYFKREEPIAYVIEHGAGYNHEVSEAFRLTFVDEQRRHMFRLGSLTFETKDRAVQLQAADMLAYEAWKDDCNSYLLQPNERRKRRVSIGKLTQAPHMRLYFGRAELEEAARLDESGYVKEFPEVVVSFTKPDINAVTFSADSSELEEMLDELMRLMELSPQLIYPLIDTSASVSKLISIDTDNVSATTADKVRVLFKPTDFLLSLMPTLRASEGQSGISE
ncbi:MAG: DUF3800 domain-containing protein [Pyrinomonadaceae bacterium]